MAAIRRLELPVVLGPPPAVAAMLGHGDIEARQVRITARRSNADIRRHRRILAVEGGLAAVHRNRVGVRHSGSAYRKPLEAGDLFRIPKLFQHPQPRLHLGAVAGDERPLTPHAGRVGQGAGSFE